MAEAEIRSLANRRSWFFAATRRARGHEERGSELNSLVRSTDSTRAGAKASLSNGRISTADRQAGYEALRGRGFPDAPKPSSEETFIVSGAPESFVDYAPPRPNSWIRFSKFGYAI